MESVFSSLPIEARLAAAQAHIESRYHVPFGTIGVVLGSGLGNFANEVQQQAAFSAAEIPHYPASGVAGHDGKLVFGTLPSSGEAKSVALVSGRVHLYEGRSAEDVVFYVRLLHELGVQTLVLTNAAGGINPNYEAGDLCLITDHLNMMFDSGIGQLLPQSESQRRPATYDPRLRDLFFNAALDARIPMWKGVYASVKGPSYETKAEVQMLGRLGADLVGMSTVPEAIAASALGMRVVAVSLVTNKAAGLGDAVLSHKDVQDVAKYAREKFSRLLKSFLTESMARRRRIAV